MSRPPQRFRGELIQGHKGVVAILVPFDPEEVWGLKPVRLEGRRHGWLVKGSLGRAPFEGYIGFRWNRFFILVEPALLAKIEAKPGDAVEVQLRTTSAGKTLARARRQSTMTTQPKKARHDVVESR